MKQLEIGDLVIKPTLEYAFVLIDMTDWEVPAGVKGSDFVPPMRRGSQAGRRRVDSVRKTCKFMIHGTYDEGGNRHSDSFVGIQENIDILSSKSYPQKGETLPLKVTMPDNSIRAGEGHVVDIAWSEIYPTHIFATIDVEVPLGVLRQEVRQETYISESDASPITINTGGTADIYDVVVQSSSGTFTYVEVESNDFTNENNSPARVRLDPAYDFDYFAIDTGNKTVTLLEAGTSEREDAPNELVRTVAHDEWLPMKRGSAEIAFDFNTSTTGDGEIVLKWKAAFR